MNQKQMTERDEERAAARIARQIQDQLRSAAPREERTPAPAQAAADLVAQVEQIVEWGLTELRQQLEQLELDYDAPRLEVDYTRAMDALRRAVAAAHFTPPLTISEYAALATHLANDVALTVRTLVEGASEERERSQRFSASSLNKWARNRKRLTSINPETVELLYGPDEPATPAITSVTRDADGNYTATYDPGSPDSADNLPAQWVNQFLNR